MTPEWPAGFAWAAAGLGGWIWGSFLNQLVDRLSPAPPAQSGAKEAAIRAGIFSPLRSLCLACGAAIAWYDNLPILSFLGLRGRCRRCGAAIGRRTLVIECATPLFGLVIFAVWDVTVFAAAASLTASWAILAIAFRWEERPFPRGFGAAGFVFWAVFVSLLIARRFGIV